MNDVVIKKVGDTIVSERDIKIIERYSNGFNASEIAREFKQSVRTIEAAIARLKSKFNCYTVVQLVAEFLRKELIK